MNIIKHNREGPRLLREYCIQVPVVELRYKIWSGFEFFLVATESNWIGSRLILNNGKQNFSLHIDGLVIT